MRSLRAVLHAAAAASLVFAAACADSTSAPAGEPAPGGVPGQPSMVRLECRATVASRTVVCAEPGAAAGVRVDRILGQNNGMKLTSSNIAIVADSFTFDMTVTNQLEYPVGTTDGVNPDPNGIRVFFVDGIHTTGGTGTVTVANADGTGTFTASGQAYFAYHGVLQPGATTAPRRWKLRFDPGVETFTFGMYVSTPVPPGGGRVWMTVLSPGRNSLVGDSVRVQVRVDSAPASIQSVTASISDRSVVLAPISPGVLAGTLHLDSLSPGPVELRVHGVTVRADTGNVAVPITKDVPPVLVVSAPLANYVASPNLRIDVDCTDDDPAGCASVTATAQRSEFSPIVQIASGTTGIHAYVSLSAFPDGATIRFRAVDSGGQSRSQSLTVLVESSPALVYLDSAGSSAMDLDSARLLFSDAANGVWVRDRGTGTRTPVTVAPSVYGWLHPQGAIFASTASFGHVFDWRSGTLVDLGVGNSTSSLVAKGSWAIWSSGATLLRRDLAAGTNLTVSTVAINNGSDVAANGDVVFAVAATRDVYRYRSGVETRITADLDSAHWNMMPVTDGVNVLYTKSDQHGSTQPVQKTHVAWWDGASETVLSDTSVLSRYGANGGWIGYPSTDGSGLSQVRTRAPDGTVRQVTSTGFSSYLVALGPDGTVAYSSNGSLYVIRAPYSGAPVPLGIGRPVFRGTELLVFLGNTVFRATY